MIKVSFWATSALLVLLACAVHPGTARNYRHTKEEQALTNQVVINQRDCAPDETPIFIHTAAVTSGKYFERRMTIRRTWGREASKYRMRLFFVIGVPRNLIFERQLKAESDKYGDILQFNFIEGIPCKQFNHILTLNFFPNVYAQIIIT